MRSVWSVRAYSKGDENGIFELWKAVHGESPDIDEWMEWWKWKYVDNPAGAPRIWLADHNGKIVGQYPLMPITMKIEGETITGSQMVDLMVHPKYRRQGMFLSLAQKAFDECGKNGLHISYGFPNVSAYGGHLKSGWFDVCPIQTMIKPLNVKSILEKQIANNFLLKLSTVVSTLIINLFYKAKQPPKVDGLKIKKISFFDNNINRLWEKISKDYDVIAMRDKNYLNWRYVDSPNSNYTIYVAEKNGEMCGYMVLGCGEQWGLLFGYMVDFVVPLNKSKVAHCLVSKAIEKFNDDKVDLIFYQMIGNNMYRKIFRRNGFIFSRYISRRFRFIARVNTDKISEASIGDYKRWFVQQGDSDNI